MPASAQAAKKPRTAKKPKDANAPKRPLSGYFMWLQGERAECQKKNPSLKGPQLVKLLGEKWAAMSDAQKKPFQSKAEKNMAKYRIDLAAYKETSDYADHQNALVAHKASAASGGRPKDLSAPKRPMSAYFLWLQANREDIKAEVGGSKASDVAKAAGEKWAGMSDGKKAPWQKKAATAKAKYEKELAAYKKTDAYKEYQDALEDHKQKKRALDNKGKEQKKKAKKAKSEDPNAPAKPMSAFDFYAKKNRAKVAKADKGASFTAQTTKMRSSWRDMDSDDKAPFVAQAAKAKAKYQKELAKYNENK